jgi:transposase
MLHSMFRFAPPTSTWSTRRASVFGGKCATEPDALAALVRKRASDVVRVGLETGFFSTWLCHALAGAGLPIVCTDARQAKAVLSVRPNKTDANDPEGLAQLLRNLITARRQLVRTKVDLANQLRGILRTFGLALPPGGGGRHFEAAVRERAARRPGLSLIIMPVVETWRAVRERVAVLDKAAVAAAHHDPRCRLLMSAPGVGAITALTYVGTVEDPQLLKAGRAVGAWLGLTPRRYQSGQIDAVGRITHCGDSLLHTAVYEAASQALTRLHAASALRCWGLMLKARTGHKKAVVAVARKLAVTLCAMWNTGAASTAEPARVETACVRT